MPDGGWGETFKSCETATYCQHERSQVAMTSWALLALMAAKFPDREVLRRGFNVWLPNKASNPVDAQH